MKNIYGACLITFVSMQMIAMDKARTVQETATSAKRQNSQASVVQTNAQLQTRFKQKQQVFKQKYNNYTIGGYIMSMEQTQGEN